MELNTQQLAILQKEAGPTLDWLQQSIAINGGLGSSAFYSRIRHPLRGWSPAYPETTGYLIPTLLDYGQLLDSPLITSQALLCGEWMLTIQNPAGWFPALYADSGKPSLFNTGMILFGLNTLFLKTKDERYFQSIEMAANWMKEVAEKGGWKEFDSKHTPTYYVRAIWGLVVANEVLRKEAITQFCKKSLHTFSEKIQTSGWIHDWQFEGQDIVFTHTMAYTWRGFLEATNLLDENTLLEICSQSFKSFINKVGQPKNLMGAYRPGFEKAGDFQCLPGLYQLSIVSLRCYEVTGDAQFLDWGILCFEHGKTLHQSSWYGKEGGIFGSYPANGGYMRYKQPNWAAKFYLDALCMYIKNKEELL